MINKNAKELLCSLITQSTKDELIWMSGYLSGVLSEQQSTPIIQQDVLINNITLLYITDTGNSKKIAFELNDKLKKIGIKTKIKAIEQYNSASIVKEEYMGIVVSTHGDGELPEVSHNFWNYLLESKPDLSKVKYFMLALGDSNYPLFCEAGNILDKKLQNLGANPLAQLTNMDLDWQDNINNWYTQTISLLKNGAQTQQITQQKAKKKGATNKGTITNNIILNDEGSNKEIHHIEIEAGDVHYEAGDSIGIKINNQKPRLYSIASSPNLHEGEVHLTIKKLRGGLCSSYLAGLKCGDTIEFYVSPNSSFKLPKNNKDIIMICAGTGIAPFRGFLAERDASLASGKSWLFFGEQHAKTDFLYQSELQDYLKSNVLTKLCLAFSRDQEQKVYVQDKIKQNASNIKQWIENDAYIYVCGDKTGMAAGVENSLKEILTDNGLKQLAENGRYLKDVY